MTTTIQPEQKENNLEKLLNGLEKFLIYKKDFSDMQFTVADALIKSPFRYEGPLSLKKNETDLSEINLLIDNCKNFLVEAQVFAESTSNSPRYGMATLTSFFEFKENAKKLCEKIAEIKENNKNCSSKIANCPGGKDWLIKRGVERIPKKIALPALPVKQKYEDIIEKLENDLFSSLQNCQSPLKPTRREKVIDANQKVNVDPSAPVGNSNKTRFNPQLHIISCTAYKNLEVKISKYRLSEMAEMAEMAKLQADWSPVIGKHTESNSLNAQQAKSEKEVSSEIEGTDPWVLIENISADTSSEGNSISSSYGNNGHGSAKANSWLSTLTAGLF